MPKKKVLGELVAFKNTNGYILDGIFYQNPRNETTVIHVHGSFGNFYHNDFLKLMAGMYLDAGINLLSFNLVAHDGLAEICHYIDENNPDEVEYVGYSVVDFSSCLSDIQGAINFVLPFSNKIVLQGHSLGCDRVVHFLMSTRTNYDAILIGPSDSYNLHKTFRSKNTSESLEAQIKRLRSRKPMEDQYDWLLFNEYGIAQPPSQEYTIPVTSSTLLSVMTGPPFKLFNLEHPIDYYIDTRVLVYLGGKDDFRTWSSDIFYSHFEKRFRDVTRVFFPNSDHYMRGVEEKAIQNYIDWLGK